MKIIETHISEQRFLSRLENLCTKKTRLDKGYEDKEVFVVQQKNNTFWIAKHHPRVSRGARAYTGDCLFCKYSKNQNGYIVVHFKYGKRPLYWMSSAIALVACLFLLPSVVYDAIVNHRAELAEVLITALCCLAAFGLAFWRSKKECRELEEQLLEICNITD